MSHVHTIDDSHDVAGGDRATRRLGWVLALSVGYAVAEVVGGWLSNSLALLADAGHMLGDVMALTLALLAAWSARRPADTSRTYGYQRVEILAALFNGVALIVVALMILREAWGRVGTPPEVDFRMMGGVAFGGLLVNLVAVRLLGGHQHGLNMRAAYLHVLGDLLGSIGALVAAGLIAAFGWKLADPVASAVIATIIVVSAVRLVLASVNVLLEGAPAHLDTDEVGRCLAEVAGVGGVHDLHVWSLGGDLPLLTAHLVLDHSVSPDRVLRAASQALAERFAITHATLQVEPPDFNIVEGLSSGEAAADSPDGR